MKSEKECQDKLNEVNQALDNFKPRGPRGGKYHYSNLLQRKEFLEWVLEV